MRIRFGMLVVLVTAGCTGPLPNGSPIAPTANTISGSVVHASEPPYGAYLTLHHGVLWTGVVPYNPCKNVSAWASDQHTTSVERFSEDDPFTPENESGVFLGWTCEGGVWHSAGSLVSILD